MAVAMKERPILFSGPMILAYRRGVRLSLTIAPAFWRKWTMTKAHAIREHAGLVKPAAEDAGRQP
jgi:hypothetical protein